MTEPLWTLDEIVAATGGTILGNAPSSFSGVSIDSRTIKPGEIFCAIAGDRVDGHDYVAAALANGAGIALVSRTDDAMRSAGALLVVPDTPLKGMEALGRAARQRSTARICAVTGSVGKTSTKEMLFAALSPSGETHASPASFNNHWGVPLTLARLPREASFGVFEIGMNHAGEITPLTAMVRPHVAVITTVAASHLGHFASLDGIADAKAEILTGVEPGGAAILNRDNPYFERLAAAARAAGITRIFGFGTHADSDIRLAQSVLHPACTCMTANVMGEMVALKLGVPGAHMAANALAVLATVKLLGGDLARAALALAEAKPAKGRGVSEKLMAPNGEFVLLDESYNANPASMRAAFDLLRLKVPRGTGRRLVVLGDMLELGDAGEDLHRGLADGLHDIDLVFAAGPLMENLWDVLPAAKRAKYARSASELHQAVGDEIQAGDVVMVKGSLGSKMGPLADAVRARYAPVKGSN